ncbi:tRNA(Ile)-lysidine synthase [Planctomycetes bacterium MalM25]|nr:tRNA(Ile)-lysidine synthase [Planctomycetes bacterium MalM25]
MQDRASATPPADDLDQRVRAAWPPAVWRDVNVAVAVSGGADSVAMLRGLHALKDEAGGRGRLFVLHYNHRARSEASTGDSLWVSELANTLGWDSITGLSSQSGARSEQQLRDERRSFFRQAIQDAGARYLATGHTADDQAETVLFRALRGSGVRGLAGIRPTAPLTEACTLVRPLLSVRRSEVEAYLRSIDQPHREDATNAADVHTRNWLRNQVLPQLEERVPAARANLAGLADHAAEASDTLEALADRLLGEAALREATGWRFDSRRLADEPPGLVTAAIRLAWWRAGWPEGAMTAAAWRRLGELATLAAPFAAEVFPGGVRAESRDGCLVLASSESPGSC